MAIVDPAQIPNWTQINNWCFPRSIDLRCPYCDRSTTFPVIPTAYDTKACIASGHGECPACKKRIHIAVMLPEKWVNVDSAGGAAVVVYPSPRTSRESAVPTGILPTRVHRSYVDTIDSFNAGLWSPCVSSCRRTLEGLATDLLPKDHPKKTLAQQLRDMPENVDLGRPLVDLANLLRVGGNIGAHFDLEKEPNREVALAMLDFLEYFIGYLYQLPTEAEQLENRLEELDSEV